jgi:lipoic acid synthetase
MIMKQAKPSWLKRKLPTGPEYEKVRRLLASCKLNTVCQEAKCPNMWECFSNRTSTFMILGRQCTRNCRFCNVTSGTPDTLDPTEPLRVAKAAKELGLKYVVVTSVTRDDLPDGGSKHFAETIQAIRTAVDGVGIEVLIPDFLGDEEALKTVLSAQPDVLNHNIETVPSLYATVRPEAIYQQSLDVLKRAAQIAPHIPVKSGIMVGLGETHDQLIQTMQDLHNHGCSILTMGQYLQPSRNHLPVTEYYTPEAFDSLKETALKIGFTNVASAPFVRSSYHAESLSGRCC